MKAKARKRSAIRGNRRILYIAIVFVLSYAAASAVLRYYAVTGGTSSQAPGQNTYTLEQSRAIAELFIRASPTYSFDGSFLEFKSAQQCENEMTHEVRRAGCYRLEYSFVSTHAGYGKREEALAQVITMHDAVVVVEKGGIKSAAIDGKWDELAQKEI